SQSVLKDRMAIAETGVVAVFVHIGREIDVTLQTRGVLDRETQSESLRSAEFAANHAATTSTVANASDDAIAEAVRLAVRRAIVKDLGFKPVTMVTVVREARP
ncbi:MAG: hypothetical protein ACRELY_29120, partial [Polyangiaceae bacterium]